MAFFLTKKNSNPLVHSPYLQASISSKKGSISAMSFAACS